MTNKYLYIYIHIKSFSFLTLIDRKYLFCKLNDTFLIYPSQSYSANTGSLSNSIDIKNQKNPKPNKIKQKNYNGKEEFPNWFQLKYLIFANFTKMYDHVSTVPELLPEAWKGPMT